MGRGQHCHHLLLLLQDTPVADAKPDDIKDLLGGALFKALFKWMQESGPVYLLPTGELLSTGSTCWLLAAQHSQCACDYNQLAAFSGMFDMSKHTHAYSSCSQSNPLGLQHRIYTTWAGIGQLACYLIGEHTVHLDKHCHQSWCFTSSLLTDQPARNAAAYSKVSQIHGHLLVCNDYWPAAFSLDLPFRHS